MYGELLGGPVCEARKLSPANNPGIYEIVNYRNF